MRLELEWFIHNLEENKYYKITDRQKLNVTKAYSLTANEDTDFDELLEVEAAKDTILNIEGFGINGNIYLYAKIGATELWGTNSATAGYLTQRQSPINSPIKIDRWVPFETHVYLRVVSQIASATTPDVVILGYAYGIKLVTEAMVDRRGDPLLPKLISGEIPSQPIKIEAMGFA